VQTTPIQSRTVNEAFGFGFTARAWVNDEASSFGPRQ
jgi:hypothetical protein